MAGEQTGQAGSQAATQGAQQTPAAGGTGAGAAKDGAGTTPPATFDELYETQDEHTRGLIDGHVKGLKSALDGERASKKELERALREAAAKAEKGSEAQQALTAAADQARASKVRSEFYLQAHQAGVADLALAYLAATEDKLVREDGTADFAELKKRHPALFGGVAAAAAAAGAANAGAGSRTPSRGQTTDMNELLRRAARGV